MRAKVKMNESKRQALFYLALAVNFFTVVLLTEQQRSVYVAAITGIFATTALAMFIISGSLIVNNKMYRKKAR